MHVVSSPSAPLCRWHFAKPARLSLSVGAIDGIAKFRQNKGVLVEPIIDARSPAGRACTENLIRVDGVTESPKLAE
jgi:hypothetical protein